MTGGKVKKVIDMYKITLSNYVIAIRRLTVEKVKEYEKAGFHLQKIA